MHARVQVDMRRGNLHDPRSMRQSSYESALAPPRKWKHALAASSAPQTIEQRGGLPWIREGHGDEIRCKAIAHPKSIAERRH